MRPQSEISAKKPYQAPKLIVYGNLTEMTLTMGNKGDLDGGKTVGMRKTGEIDAVPQTAFLFKLLSPVTHSYRIYGLNLSSDSPIPGLAKNGWLCRRRPCGICAEPHGCGTAWDCQP